MTIIILSTRQVVLPEGRRDRRGRLGQHGLSENDTNANDDTNNDHSNNNDNNTTTATTTTTTTNTTTTSTTTTTNNNRFKLVKSEQQLPGAFQKNSTEGKAGYFGWSKTFGKLWFRPPPK